jgi:putative FmdB family regulatory protein
MPTYDYTCTQCGFHKEVRQKMTDQPLERCDQCEEPSLRRGPGGGIGLSFRGSGFYITDYKDAKTPSSTPSECCPCGKEKSTCSD